VDEQVVAISQATCDDFVAIRAVSLIDITLKEMSVESVDEQQKQQKAC